MGHELVSRSTRSLAGLLSGFGKKRVVAGVAAALAAGAVPVANAGIELGEGLTATGFVDMSYFSFDPDGGPSSDGFGIDQAEIDFLFAGSEGVTAELDIEFGESSAGDPDDDTTFVEQAFITKAFTDQFSVKLGRFLSYTGWETEEPTGLFQYSGVGYAGNFYGYYQQGISAMFNAGKFALMGSVVGDAFNPLDRDFDDLGIEVGAAIMPIEGLTAKAFYTVNDTGSGKTKIVNTWVSYAMSGFTFAGEFNTADYAGGGGADGFLVMANYATGPWGITGRFGQIKFDNGGGKANSITVSPSYKVGSNLLLVAEYRMDEANNGGTDSKSIAFEALFTF